VHIRNASEALRNHRGGQISHLLLGPGDFGAKNLTITWVEGEPESRQSNHTHPDSEQVYVIVRGRGRMCVGEESSLVQEGTMILIPPGASHSIENVGEDPLVYVSATAPPFALPDVDSGRAYS